MTLFDGAGPEHTPELGRILALPRRDWTKGLGGASGTTTELVGLLTEALKTPTGTQTLRPVQAATLAELHDVGGVFGPQAVGSGKSLSLYLAPAVLESKRPLLLIPAKLRSKVDRELVEYRKHWRIPALTVVSYEALSRVGQAHFLEAMAPDLLLADEAHKLKHTKSAVTRRVGRYLRVHPECKVVMLSGTIVRRSLREYWHLLRWCLGPERMPLPEDWAEMMVWAGSLDVQRDEWNQTDAGALRELCTEDEDLRSGYRRRLTDTPGVVSTVDERVSCSLSVRLITPDLNHLAPHFERLRATWETPDGYAICEATELYRRARELAQGFFYVRLSKERFRQCLTRTQRSNESIRNAIENYTPTENTIRKIESLLANELGKSMLVTALTQRRWRKSELGSADIGHPLSFKTQRWPIGSGSDIDLVSMSMTSSLRDSMGAVGCASKKKKRKLGGKVDYTSITNTKPERLEVSYVGAATGALGCLERMLNPSLELWNILGACFDEARPPESWLGPRRAWCSYVRSTLAASHTYDTEMHLVEALHKGDLRDAEGSALLDAWQDVRDTFRPDTIPVWVDDTVLRLAVEWVLRNGDCIVWSESVAPAQRLSQMFADAGKDVPYFGQQGLDDKGRDIETWIGPCILSIAANSEGRNLQRYSRNLVLSCPPSGSTWEQLLGRTHRDGQQADTVECEAIVACAEQLAGFERAKAEARFVQETTGNPQKLCYADLDLEALEGTRTGPLWVTG